MKIGVLGSGQVAKTLAAGFLKHGHDVGVGTRHTDKLAGWAAEHPNAAIEAARAIEPLCMLWCIPGFQKQDWVHAFKMLR